MYALTRGYLDSVAISNISQFEEGLKEYAQKHAKTFYKEVKETKMWTDAGEAELKKVIQEYKDAFVISK